MARGSDLWWRSDPDGVFELLPSFVFAKETALDMPRVENVKYHAWVGEYGRNAAARRAATASGSQDPNLRRSTCNGASNTVSFDAALADGLSASEPPRLVTLRLYQRLRVGR